MADRVNYSGPTRNSPRLLLLVVTLLTGAATSVVAQQPAAPAVASCVACHLSTAAAPGWAHVATWQASRHASAGVGCHDCHRGDPSARRPADAHIGVLMPPHPNSPLRRAGLPATCGGCHLAQAEAFRETGHYARLRARDGRDALPPRGPTCTTCHGNVGSRPAAERVERECRTCHGAGGTRPRFERMAGIGNVMERAGRLRVQLAAADRLVAGMPDRSAIAGAELSLAEARRLFTAAMGALHRFELDATGRDLDRAARLTTEVYDRMLSGR